MTPLSRISDNLFIPEAESAIMKRFAARMFHEIPSFVNGRVAGLPSG